MSRTERELDLFGKTTADLEYRIAATREERSAAFHLVYRAYLRSGLADTNPYRMRVTPYHLLPTTEVFVALCQDVVISTVTLVVDGALGLPMESVYGGQVSSRRARGLAVGEVSCLADRRADFRDLFPVFVQLCRLMGQYAQRQGLDELLVACHPRHGRFYQRYLGFEPIGAEAAYPSVCNNPAVALSFNFVRVSQRHPDIYERFFGNPISHEQLQPRPISPADCQHFRPVVDACFPGAPAVSHGGSPLDCDMPVAMHAG